MNQKKKAAARAVKLIIDDICDRSGLQNEWENIDADVRREIRREWVSIIEKEMDGLDL